MKLCCYFYDKASGFNFIIRIMQRQTKNIVGNSNNNIKMDQNAEVMTKK